MVRTANTIYRDNVNPKSVSVGGTYLIDGASYWVGQYYLRDWGTVEWTREPEEEVTTVHSRDLVFWDEEGG